MPETARTLTAPIEKVESGGDLAAAFAHVPAAAAHFGEPAYTHQREYVTWILEAKKPETRQRRIEKAVALLAEGTKLS